MDKLFIVAIGGTGMRCLESFVHLCAIGMFDSREIEILTLDTDHANGNMGRTWDLIGLYNRIKTTPGKTPGGEHSENTFFSAKLNLNKFTVNYNDPHRRTFRNISELSGGDAQRENQLLSDLFLEQETHQEFNLEHGYRAQTHLGSHLMYHAILESARKSLKNDQVGEAEKNLDDFIIKLQRAGEKARVFIFGSVFGGTGASSIPILPLAFRDALKIRSDGKETLDLKKIKFGATLLTEYFSFQRPDAQETREKSDSIVADSSFFPLNSQAALQFYQQDPTVNEVYNRFYHIGWPLGSAPLNGTTNTQLVTGGSNQKNDCHIVELLCACAAYDFLMGTPIVKKQTEYVFRSVGFENNTFNFEGKDLISNSIDPDDKLMHKLGAFLSFAHIVLSKNQAAWKGKGVKGLLDQLKENNIGDYSVISDEEAKEIDQYLRLFGYQFSNDGTLRRGWIYQIHKSIGSGRFIFDKAKAFNENAKELPNTDFGALFIDEKNHWKKTFFSSRYDGFINKLTALKSPDKPSTKTKFLALLYQAITESQNFNSTKN